MSSFIVAFYFAAGNLLMFAIMILLQYWMLNNRMIPVQGTIIPGTRQKFLYLQDFYCMIYGDTISLTMISASFGWLIGGGKMGWELLAIIPITLIDRHLFNKMCLGKDHKPDWGYPETGKISIGGQFHSWYHGLQVSMAVLCIYHLMFTGIFNGLPTWGGDLRGLPMWIGLLGGATYVAFFIIDVVKGKFDPIKRVEN